MTTARFAIVGDGATIDGRWEPVTSPCSPLLPRAFYCLPCHQQLANQFQLSLHLRTGDHLIAGRCPVHGLEQLERVYHADLLAVLELWTAMGDLSVWSLSASRTPDLPVRVSQHPP